VTGYADFKAVTAFKPHRWRIGGDERCHDFISGVVVAGVGHRLATFDQKVARLQEGRAAVVNVDGALTLVFSFPAFVASADPAALGGLDIGNGFRPAGIHLFHGRQWPAA
jgi:hypothetical protein